jgi:hypothetical protein
MKTECLGGDASVVTVQQPLHDDMKPKPSLLQRKTEWVANQIFVSYPSVGFMLRYSFHEYALLSVIDRCLALNMMPAQWSAKGLSMELSFALIAVVTQIMNDVFFDAEKDKNINGVPISKEPQQLIV